jgi:hypothetical protein
MTPIRKYIKEYITANGPSTAPTLVKDSVLKGALPDRVESIIVRMTANGKLIKSGDDYDIAP